MRRVGVGLVVGSLLCVAGTAAAAPGDVVSQIPAPGQHTTGLATDGTWLYAATLREGGQPGPTNQDGLYRVNPADGAVDASRATMNQSFHGLAWDGANLWGSEGGDTLVQLDTTLAELATFGAPGVEVGLTYSAELARLILASSSDDTLYFIDPATGVSDSSVASAAPSGGLDLAWDGCAIWQVNSTDDMLHRIDPTDGSVLSSLPAPGTTAEGLTFDGTNLWVSDADSDMIYAVEVSDDADADGILALCDVCPDDADPMQEDCDGDGIGDACDADCTCCSTGMDMGGGGDMGVVDMGGSSDMGVADMGGADGGDAGAPADAGGGDMSTPDSPDAGGTANNDNNAPIPSGDTGPVNGGIPEDLGLNVADETLGGGGCCATTSASSTDPSLVLLALALGSWRRRRRRR